MIIYLSKIKEDYIESNAFESQSAVQADLLLIMWTNELTYIDLWLMVVGSFFISKYVFVI